MSNLADTAAYGIARRFVMSELEITGPTFYYGNGKEAVIARQLVSYALHHYAGWTYTDIAILLGVQVSTVSRSVAKIKSLSDIEEVVTLCRGLQRAILSIDIDMSTVGDAQSPGELTDS